MAEYIAPIPQTPVRTRSGGLFPPPSHHGSRSGSPRPPPADFTPIPFSSSPKDSPFAHIAANISHTVGEHVNSDDPIFFAIQRTLTEGNLDGQVLTTLCLLLM
jgi:hypothetical protein